MAGRHKKDSIPVCMRLNPDAVRKLDILRRLKGAPSGGGNGETYEPVIEYLLSLCPPELKQDAEKKVEAIRGLNRPISKGWNDLTYGSTIDYLLSLVPESQFFDGRKKLGIG